MNTLSGQSEVTRVEVPLPEDLAEELIGLWETTFETSYDGFRNQLAAGESAQNSDTVYLIRKGEHLGGTCHLTVSRSNPELGGLGEVATPPEFRRMGIATRLCTDAREDFRRQGGRALFLGTVNPEAARVYARLGWRKLAGATVMALITNGDSPETFLVDSFRESGPVTVAPATAAERIPMIPLLITPHDWQVLDANAGMFSTRYAVQHSCMGLYPKYEALLREGRGAWFGARTDRGLLVGLSTACLDGSGQCQVDGFVHQNASDSWEDLLQAAVRWGVEQGAPLCRARLSVEDEEKRSRFESLGFHAAGTGEAFNLDGRQVTSARMEKATLNGAV